MKVYFLSSKPCALMLGGVYFGTTDLFERFAEIAPKDNIFAEFIPEGGLPIGFFINEKLRFEPPYGCEVYLLCDGIAVYAYDFIPTDFSLKIIAQERFLENLITVFRQGTLQISMETQKGFFVSRLPDEFDTCKILHYGELFFLESGNADGGAEKTATRSLIAFNASGNRVFYEKITEYRVEENTLIATLPLSDSKKRFADCAWAITEDGCFQTSFRLRQSAENISGAKDAAEISAELLPYAFFESVLIGADYREMLSDELKEKAEHIRSFLGDFISVILTDKSETCGLVRKKQDRLYEVDYYTAEISNGKIVDIKG